MDRDRQLFCSASTCQLPIRRGDLYHRFWNSKTWRNRLLADNTCDATIVCYRHFSPNQYCSTPHKQQELRESAIPDQRILCCRFCLDFSVDMARIQSVSSPDSSCVTLQDIVETIGIQISPEEDDEISALICLTCATKVRYIKRIQRQFQANDCKMRQMSESWKKERTELAGAVEPATKQYPAKAVKIAQAKRKVAPAKPPDEPGRPPVGDRIVSRVEVKLEPGIVAEQIVDSSGSVYMIETLDVLDEGHGEDDTLEHRLQERKSEENSGHIPPVKKIKVEKVKQEIDINDPWTSQGPGQ